VGRGAHALASLAGVSVPMHVQGLWREPRLAFDFGAASGGPLAHSAEATSDASLTFVKATAPATPAARTK